MTSRFARWDGAELPDQSGRHVVVTGANSGLGYETARTLATLGARVTLACRDVGRANEAVDKLVGSSSVPRDSLTVVELDLASLDSVRRAAEAIRADQPHLDLLINNAGVMTIPFGRSADGYERTFAINHLGHFALTGLLLESLLATPGSRVLTVSSNAHRRARSSDLERVESGTGYSPAAAYDRSKLANLLFAYALQHELSAADAKTISLAAHPGNARTDLWRTSSRLERALLAPRLGLLTSRLVQSAEDGALPILRAALDPSARGGDYYGPAGWQGNTGRPVRVKSSTDSYDRSAQRALWQQSEQLTRVTYPLSGEAGAPG
ncbi:MAG TPA: oxidoreductase [Gaiellaceae bacterium]|nr:oxidoreductase [Gaiellaceae bacterium]